MHRMSTVESLFFCGLFFGAAVLTVVGLADVVLVPSLTEGLARGGPVATAIVQVVR